MTQIALVHIFTTKEEPDLSNQEEININYIPEANETFLEDRDDIDIEVREENLIPKITIFDPPEDIEETEELNDTLDQLNSKDACIRYLNNGIMKWKPFNFH
jgi:hypothetical protein